MGKVDHEPLKMKATYFSETLGILKGLIVTSKKTGIWVTISLLRSIVSTDVLFQIGFME